MGLTGKSGLRVALCALNPHAGEGGAFGREEAVLERAVAMAEADFERFDGSAASAPFAHVPSPFGLGPAPAGWSIFAGPPPAGPPSPTSARSPSPLRASPARCPRTPCSSGPRAASSTWWWRSTTTRA